MSYFKAKMHQIRFRLRFHPRPRWGGSLQRSSDPELDLRGLLLREGRGVRTRGKSIGGGDGRGGKVIGGYGKGGEKRGMEEERRAREMRGGEGRGEEEDFHPFAQFQICHYTTANYPPIHLVLRADAGQRKTAHRGHAVKVSERAGGEHRPHIPSSDSTVT